MPRWNVDFGGHVRTDPDVVANLAQVKALSSVIGGIPVPPSVDERLHRLNIARAVRGTTVIEGADVSEEEVAQIMETPPSQRVLPANRADDEQEVRNAQELMRTVATLLRQAPSTALTEGLICQFHEILTKSVPYANNAPGRYRTSGVSAGTYLAPPHEEVPALMSEFVRWMATGTPQSWDPVIRALMGHFYLVSIHPFGDGNGRTSRAVEAFLLAQAGVNVRGFYSLANYYYRNRTRYVETLDHLRFVSFPDLTPFVQFGLTGLAEELETVRAELLDEVRLIVYRDFAREQVQELGKLGSKVGERLIAFVWLLGRGSVPVRAIRQGGHPIAELYKGVTRKTLARDLNLLRDVGLIVMEGGNVRANVHAMEQFTEGFPSL